MAGQKPQDDEDSKKTYEAHINSKFVTTWSKKKDIDLDIPNQYEPGGIKRIAITIMYDRDTQAPVAIKPSSTKALIESDFRYIADNFFQILEK